MSLREAGVHHLALSLNGVTAATHDALRSCTPDEFEMLFGKLHTLAQTAPFIIKVTEGQHNRRFLLQHGGIGPMGTR